MFLANLSLGEFLALFGAAAAVTVALYLLVRSRRHHMVSTLRFWQEARLPVRAQRRRRIEQPLSLLLQLLAVLFLILAIAQPRWGSRQTSARHHVLLLDASAWVSAKTRRGTAIDEARQMALRWLSALPAGDQVMVVRADTGLTPLTPFDSDRARIAQAIRGVQPGSGVPSLETAFQFAQQAQRLAGGSAGEIVYAGPGRTSPGSRQAPAPPNLRLLNVDVRGENAGITRLHARPGGGGWQVSVAVRNYGAARHVIPVGLAFGGAPAAARTLTLEAGAENSIEFNVATRAAGILEARLGVRDIVEADDRASVELPAQPPLRVTVYSANPEALRPLLAADPRVEARYATPEAYQPAADGDLLVIDRFAPPQAPRRPAIWIDAPGTQTVHDAHIREWRAGHPLSAGIHSRDTRLARASVFRLAAGDVALAAAAEGPVVVVRPDPHKLLLIGFDPFASTARYELSLPLLFANALEWMMPDSARPRDITASPIGASSVALGAGPAARRVLDEAGAELPYTVSGGELKLFAAAPTRVRVLGGPSEQVLSLTLPNMGEAQWEAPANVARGVPPAGSGGSGPRDLWKWFAAAGLAALAAEWWLFGRARAGAPAWSKAA